MKNLIALIFLCAFVTQFVYDKDKTTEKKQIHLDVYNSVLEIENEVAETFVLENTENIVGAFVFSNFLQIDSYSKLDSIYKLFSPELYASDYLIRIKQKLDALSRIQIGEPFPPFSITTNQGKNLELTNLKGKYVVLDFWGTWCAPCIKGIPKMKEYYSKYQDRVEFIGIACNDSSEKWRAAIEKYGLSWPQVFNGSGNDDLKVRYNVETFPTKMIIDPTGVLIQSHKGETEDFYMELDSLFRSSN